jgi:hypothetical protein
MQQERKTGVSLKLKVRDVKVTLVTDFRYWGGDINLDTFNRRQENGCSLILYIVQPKSAKDISNRETTERFKA